MNILRNRLLGASVYSLLVAVLLTACGSDDNGGGTTTERNDNKNTAYTDNAATRIEVPHLQGGNSKFIVYRTSDKSFDKDGVNYCVEWDRDLKANRWSCYILTKKNIAGNSQRWGGGYGSSQEDYKKAYRESENSSKSVYFFDQTNLTLDDYYHYNDNGATHCYIHKASGFSHGHICNSQDRTYSSGPKNVVGEINKQTFYLTNMQPQYSAFNNGIWLTMENFVHNFAAKNYKFASNDTLFVCKGGTIDNADQILMRVDSKLIVPKYYYAALVWKRTNENKYYGIAFWFEHTNVNHGGDSLKGYAYSIDEVEKKLGNKIDFFCNLPDNIENKVESIAAITSFGL